MILDADKIDRCSFCNREFPLYKLVVFFNIDVNFCDECKVKYSLDFNEYHIKEKYEQIVLKKADGLEYNNNRDNDSETKQI